MIQSNTTIAAPTRTMVMVWPMPHQTPIQAAGRTSRSRPTVAATAATWSASVAWRIPSRNPSAIVEPNVIARRPDSARVSQSFFFSNRGDGTRCDNPARGIVLFQDEVAAHPAEDHRLRDRTLLGPQTEVDVNDDERNQSDSREAVQHVHPSPRHIGEEIRIAGEENRSHPKHHEDA